MRSIMKTQFSGTSVSMESLVRIIDVIVPG